MTAFVGSFRRTSPLLVEPDIYGPDFPGETFRVLKQKELKRYGEYRTRRLVLARWDEMFGGGRRDG